MEIAGRLEEHQVKIEVAHVRGRYTPDRWRRGRLTVTAVPLRSARPD
jgi:hypothetical protein